MEYYQYVNTHTACMNDLLNTATTMKQVEYARKMLVRTEECMMILQLNHAAAERATKHFQNGDHAVELCFYDIEELEEGFTQAEKAERGYGHFTRVSQGYEWISSASEGGPIKREVPRDLDTLIALVVDQGGGIGVGYADGSEIYITLLQTHNELMGY